MHNGIIKMKKSAKISMLLLMALSVLYQSVCFLSAQEITSGYHFQLIKELPATPVKNQSRSSTCWSFSTISFLESELLRTGKNETDLSEMFIVYHVYLEKAIRYVRMHGRNYKSWFAKKAVEVKPMMLPG